MQLPKDWHRREDVEAALPKTCPYRVYYVNSIPSTNTALKEMGAEAENTILWAGEQTAGRGRLGRCFFSPRGSGLYLSLVMRPPIRPEDAGLVTTYAAVAAARALRALFGFSADIKWVNDLLFRGKKLCGILAEAGITRGKVDFVILGIGINLCAVDYPPELESAAISVEDIIGRKPDAAAVAAALLSELYAMPFGRFDGQVMEEYRRESAVLGKTLWVLPAFGEKYEATAVDILPGGELVVRLPEGEERILQGGEVSLRPAGGQSFETGGKPI